MSKDSPLGKLIAELQSTIKNAKLDESYIRQSTERLENLGYVYDSEKYPVLTGTENFTDNSIKTPNNLAEALLWKLGKWKSYKTFCQYYSDNEAAPTKTDVVFYAFARHLKDENNPIYDQHAVRALWAICDKFSKDERVKCRSLLFNKKIKWKQSGYGKNTINCYRTFEKHISDIVSKSNGASKHDLDRLLMSLGQAIKDATDTYAQFDSLCGWPENG